MRMFTTWIRPTMMLYGTSLVNRKDRRRSQDMIRLTMNTIWPDYQAVQEVRCPSDDWYSQEDLLWFPEFSHPEKGFDTDCKLSQSFSFKTG